MLVVLCNKILHLPKAGDKKVWETCRTTERSVVTNGQEWTVQPNWILTKYWTKVGRKFEEG